MSRRKYETQLLFQDIAKDSDLENTIFVLDTSVPMDDEMAVHKFKKGTVVWPSTVTEELNGLKDSKIELKSKVAQDVLDELDRLTLEYENCIHEGIPLEGGGKLILELNHKSLSSLENAFDGEINDNKILAVAKNYTKEEAEKPNGKTVYLITNDVGMRVKARSLKVKTLGYDSDVVIKKASEVYKGFREVYVDELTLFDFFKNGKVSAEVLKSEETQPYLNEFIIMKNETNTDSTAFGRIVNENGKLIVRKLLVDKQTNIFGLNPLDLGQEMAFDLLLDDDIKFVSLLGKAGIGKTVLALAAALRLLEEGKYRKIILMRSLVLAGGKDADLGFLPGDLDEKLKPYMAPYYDNLEFIFDKKMGKAKAKNNDKNNDKENDKDVINLEHILATKYEGKIVIESTGYMRGRSLNNVLIIVDESQNLTKSEVKTLLTRAGHGSRIWLLGDNYQIDSKYLTTTNNGIVYSTEKMKHTEISGTVFLSGKSKRSLLADLASELL